MKKLHLHYPTNHLVNLETGEVKKVFLSNPTGKSIANYIREVIDDDVTIVTNNRHYFIVGSDRTPHKWVEEDFEYVDNKEKLQESRKPKINPVTGCVDLKYNVTEMLQDFYIAQR